MKGDTEESLLSCPHCGEVLQSDARHAGLEVLCSSCQQPILVPVAPPVIEDPTAASPEAASEKRSRLPLVIGGVLVGAACGFAIFGAPVAALVGALFGFLVVWRMAENRSRRDDPAGVPSRFSNAILGLILSAGSWGIALLMWGWVITRPPSAFHDQGGMIITFVILPLTFLCWTIGGPAAAIVSRRGLKQIQSGARPESDRWIARAGIVLSQLMSVALLGFLIWLVAVNAR